nr:MAG TPA: hypothetical protein [Caudoviricetes sp.]DAR81701.1 MAG TPA: hypothetical protein [Caudoviricetes sp.]DAU62537.1 MAG TPA: hypothetical protein [Caudoviricetes sp.]
MKAALVSKIAKNTVTTRKNTKAVKKILIN